MKHILTGFSLIGAFALLSLSVGCTGMQTQSKENLLIAVGFKTVVSKTAAQQQKLQALPSEVLSQWPQSAGQTSSGTRSLSRTPSGPSPVENEI